MQCYFVDGWMDVKCLTSDELLGGLLPTVWESSQRLIERQYISQIWSLDKWRGHHFAKVPPRGIIDRKLGHEGFYMHQAPLAYMVVFSQRRASNPGSPVSSPTLYRLGYHDQAILCHSKNRNFFAVVHS